MTNKEQTLKRGTKYLLLWALLLIPTAFSILALLATFVYAPDPTTRTIVAAVWGACIAMTGVPFALFLLFWWREHARTARLEAVGAILRVYESIPLADLASRLGKDEPVAERLAAAAIADGFAQGFIEYPSRMFVNTAFGVRPPPPPPTREVTAQTEPLLGTDAPPSRLCRKCGNRVYPVEGTQDWRCWNCGSVQKTEG